MIPPSVISVSIAVEFRSGAKRMGHILTGSIFLCLLRAFRVFSGYLPQPSKYTQARKNGKQVYKNDCHVSNDNEKIFSKSSQNSGVASVNNSNHNRLLPPPNFFQLAGSARACYKRLNFLRLR
jgi:hypothetical protein